jgi:hypothetical protein
MKITKQVDLGEYIINIEYNDDGSGYLKVTILDELEEEVENIEIMNDNDSDINPNLN